MRPLRFAPNDTTYYHCISRVRGLDMLINNGEKQVLLDTINKVSGFSGVEVKTYCLLDNHFHIVIKVPKRREVDDRELERRMRVLYGGAKTEKRLAAWELWISKGDAAKVDAEKAALRKRMYNLSAFFKNLKERFAMDFNRRNGCSGVFWGGRFKSILLAPESGVLAPVGAYVDMNPVRAEIAKNPEEYEYSGFGAASRGDAAAVAGIRELLDPSNANAIADKNVCPAYKRVMEGGMPPRYLGSDPKKKGSDPKLSAVEKARRAEGLRKRRFDLIAGVAIGSLKFVGKVALAMLCAGLGAGGTVRGHGLEHRAWYGSHDGYYRARRVGELQVK